MVPHKLRRSQNHLKNSHNTYYLFCSVHSIATRTTSMYVILFRATVLILIWLYLLSTKLHVYIQYALSNKSHIKLTNPIWKQSNMYSLSFSIIILLLVWSMMKKREKNKHTTALSIYQWSTSISQSFGMHPLGWLFFTRALFLEWGI